MCDLGSHCLHLYYNCLRRDSEVQTAVIREKDNEVDYLLENLALRVTILFRYAAKAPARHLKRICCLMSC